jgi:L-alanine-DL-glutamate epimerase-like enolase superfamily enzyme
MARTTRELEAFEAADALDVYQPDAVLSVGLLRERELAERVTARGHFFAPHTWTNGIGLLANLHLTAGVGGGPYFEFPYDPPGWTPERRDFMLAEPVRVDAEGFVTVPDRPGLGFELADDLV